MDKIIESKKKVIFAERKKQFEAKAGNVKLEFFPTSIWETHIYNVWSNILGNIIPNKDKIKELLKKYCQACQADEVVLFERNTFLYISSFNNKNFKDNERFERISEGMKKFKNKCQIDSKKFNHFLLNNVKNKIYIDDFANSTCIMTVLSNKRVTLELLKINIEIGKKNLIEIMEN